MQARVIFGRDDPDQHRYEFKVTNKGRIDFGAIFHTRSAFRVRPDAHTPIDVSLQDEVGGPMTIASLYDVSISGLAVLVNMADESVLFKCQKLKIGFRLPGQDEPFELIGHVCHRKLLGSTVQYGIEFDEKTAQFEKQQDGLFRYVKEREMDLIRRGREASERGQEEV